MTTPFQIVEIPLGGQQDDKTARLMRGNDTLRLAQNVEHSHQGEARKRRGYERIPLTSATTHNETPEAIFLTVGTYQGELVLVGREETYSVHTVDLNVDSASLTRRGPSLVGNIKRWTVHTSPLGASS